MEDGSDVPVDEQSLRSAAGSRRVVVHRNESRCGGAAARNVGVAVSAGEFVAFLDDDDIYYPNKLADLMDVLLGDESADAAFGKVQLMSRAGGVERFIYPSRFDARVNTILMNVIHNNATLIRARVLRRVRFLESLPRYQDLQFNIELSWRARVVFVDRYVAEWRVDDRPDQVTTTGDREKEERDLRAFEAIYAYLRDGLAIPLGLLALFELRLMRLFVRQAMYMRAVRFLLRPRALTVAPFSVIRALALRRRFWTR